MATIQQSPKRGALQQFGIGGGARQKFTESEKRLVLLLVVTLLIIIALIIVLSNITAPPSSGQLGFSKCNGYAISTQKYSCLTTLAESTKNTTLCNLMPPYERNNCLLGVAQLAASINVCNLINSSSPYYSQCIGTVSATISNASACSTLSGYPLEQCLSNSYSSLTLAQCGAMQNQSSKNVCLYVYYYKSAIGFRNGTYCGMLPNATNESVLQTLVKIQYGNVTTATANVTLPELYGLQSANPTLRQFCYYQLAQEEINKSMCGIAGGTVAALCNASLTPVNTTPAFNLTAKNITDACSSITSLAKKTACELNYYSFQAAQSKNASKCALINSSFTYAWCISMGGSPSGCNATSASQLQGNCYEVIALETQNASVCADIVNQSTKTQCLLYSSLKNLATTTSIPPGYYSTSTIP